MKKEKSITINFIMNSLMSMSSLIFPLITFPYISRILHPAGTGKVSFATSVISYFVMISQLGIPTYGIRKCAQVKDDKIELSRVSHELLIINLIMSIVSYIGLAICVLIFSNLRNEKTLIFIISSTILLSAIGMEWLYKGLEEYTYITIRSIIFKFIALIVMFIFIHSEEDYVVYGGISILAASASNICNLLNIRKYIRCKYIGNYNLKRHIKPVLVFFGMSCATTIYTNLDTVMLGFMSTDSYVGYYNAAIKIKAILISIITSLGAVLLPRASYYIGIGDKERFNEILAKSLRFVVWFSIPLCLYFCSFSKECIVFISGMDYMNAIMPMQILMPTIVLIGFSNIVGMQVLVPLGKERYVLYSEIIGAIVDLGINLILIPRYNAVGAAIGTLFAELVVLVVQLWLVKSEDVSKINIGYAIKMVLISIVCISIVLPIKLLPLNNILILILSSAIFSAMYLGILIICKDDVTQDMLLRLLRYIRIRRGKE